MISNLNVYTNIRPSFRAKLTVLNNSQPQIYGGYSSSYLKSKADEYLQNGNFERAIAYYKSALNADPYNADIHLNLAKTYGFNSQYKEAIPHLQAYLGKNPEDIENITLLGENYKKAGLYAKAIECFNRALGIEPNYDYAKRNLLDTQNLRLACINPQKARQERYNTAIKNLTEAVKIAKNFFPSGYMDDMKDMTVSFDKTSKMGGRTNIAQYEHNKRKISVTDEYTYADPRLTGAYLIHEFVHGKDNDPYTSIREEQDAYRIQAQYWLNNVRDIYDPEMDYVAGLYNQSAKALDDRVAEIYKLRDPSIAEVSYNHPPSTRKLSAFFLSKAAQQPLKAYEIIV